MYSSIRSICFSASAAPFAPSLASAWTRSSRERTSEYSAATKNAFIRIEQPGRPAAGRLARGGRPRRPRRSYFEEVLGRASASDRRLPEAPGGTARVVEPRRAVALVLPDHRRAAARARDPRPPGIASARARVAHRSRLPAFRPHGAHRAPAGARILEGDDRARLADGAQRRGRTSIPGARRTGRPAGSSPPGTRRRCRTPVRACVAAASVLRQSVQAIRGLPAPSNAGSGESASSSWSSASSVTRTCLPNVLPPCSRAARTRPSRSPRSRAM